MEQIIERPCSHHQSDPLAAMMCLISGRIPSDAFFCHDPGINSDIVCMDTVSVQQYVSYI